MVYMAQNQISNNLYERKRNVDKFIVRNVTKHEIMARAMITLGNLLCILSYHACSYNSLYIYLVTAPDHFKRI